MTCWPDRCNNNREVLESIQTSSEFFICVVFVSGINTNLATVLTKNNSKTFGIINHNRDKPKYN